jgi:hypothetical protein
MRRQPVVASSFAVWAALGCALAAAQSPAEHWVPSRIALNRLQQDTSRKVGIKSKRLLAGWDHDYLLGLLGS